MSSQAVGSVLMGLMVTAVLFLPLVVWQYRRYGRFDASRMLWTSAGFIYASAIVAFTVFPLPEFTPGFCAAERTSPQLDPLRFPTEVAGLVADAGPSALLTDWLVWEFALNIVLFIPFGLIVRRVFEWPRGVVFFAGFVTSFLIEVTQATGNWGLMPCPYRVADVTDLFTNTTGAAVGIVLEKITPRLLSRKSHLLSQRDRARPVTHGRRILGMLLDTWYLSLAVIAGGTVVSAAYTISHGGPAEQLTSEQLLDLERLIFVGAGLAALLTAVLPACLTNGASLGQRTVYLVPVSNDGHGWQLAVRSVVVQGSAAVLLSAGFPWVLLVSCLGAGSLVSACMSVRGISCIVAGCDIQDSRSVTPEAPVRPV
ncbi:VanZ family protein [Corynebacterium glyciniphilum]|uniref:VanZ family protein n=1 Tax=Corynebacterium glyciniphilum TaxID=1404244 RepID=UPI003DA179F5